jgi:conjugative transfer signal peptidase TraF
MIVRKPLLGILFGVAALVAASWLTPSIRLVYNPSDSAPRGWYLVLPATEFSVGDYVLARLPSDTAALAAARDYLPRSVPILKQIAAVAGQRVCIRDAVVYVDGAPLARTLDRDSKGRPLTPWRHCEQLDAGDLFLLNTANPASFDSRYFGPIDVSFVRGHAVPLMTQELR